MKNVTKEMIDSYERHLIEEEKSASTVNKYIRDITEFYRWVSGRGLEKALVLEYKGELCVKYAPRSVNSKISALNGFFNFFGLYEMKVKNLRIQQQMFLKSENELSHAEYELLLTVSQRKNERLYFLMQTICSTGIRVSEVRFVTVDAISRGVAEINCKGKRRSVFLPDRLCFLLRKYTDRHRIRSGPVFITKTGNPIDRSNIWSDMKALCRRCNVSEEKVFPHNLRHLFARTYYTKEKDIVRLADILGHSSINTTRIYTMESGEIHKEKIQHLGLLR